MVIWGLIFFLICISFLFHFCSSAFLLQRVVKLFFGCVAAVACGMLYAVYLSTYHDRKFWFSTKQVCDFSYSTNTIFLSSWKIHFWHIFYRNWSVKSLFRKAVGFIIITTNTCWQRHLLKEACLLMFLLNIWNFEQSEFLFSWFFLPRVIWADPRQQDYFRSDCQHSAAFIFVSRTRHKFHLQNYKQSCKYFYRLLF